MAAKPKLLEPIHPGEILLEDFMKPLDISINRLARDLVGHQAVSAALLTVNVPSRLIPR